MEEVREQIEGVLTQATEQLPRNAAVLLYLSVVLEGENATRVLQHLPSQEFESLGPLADQLLAFPTRDRNYPILDEMQRLSRLEIYRGIEEMEGSWLLQSLKKEKPSVIGLVLKHLSADKVYQVIHHMDDTLRAKIPSPTDLERVDPEILEVVRQTFEQELPSFSYPQPQKYLNIHILRNLSSADFITVVKDVGLSLLALAFQGVNERPLIELVKNLEADEAEDLFERFNEQRGANRGDIKAAQLEILNLSRDFKTSGDLLLEAGVERVAQALVDLEDDFIETLQYKLPVKSGYQLRRYVDDFRAHHLQPTLVAKSREEIVHRIYGLSRKAQIDRKWHALGFAAEEEAN